MKYYTKLLWFRVFITCSIFISYSSDIFAQNNSSATASYYVEQLSQKGIQLEITAAEKLSMSDFEKISEFDFNPYRNEKTEKGVQLVNGPLVLLRSITWMTEHNLVVSDEIKQLKAGEVIDPNLQPSIVLLQIGVGFIPATNGEKWSTPTN